MEENQVKKFSLIIIPINKTWLVFCLLFKVKRLILIKSIIANLLTTWDGNLVVSTTLKKSESNFLFNGQKKEFLDWLESLRISKYWLDTMSQTDSFSLCKEIYHVLQSIKKLDLAEKEKLFSLIEIESCLQGVYEKLQCGYLEAKFPLTKEQRESIELIIHTYMELANSYYGIIIDNKNKKNSLSEQHMTLMACKGFQGLGMVFLTVSQVYTSPPKDLWLLCYRLFSVTEELNLLDNKVKIDNAIYSPAILFKKLIIFHILDKNQGSPTEIAEVFQLLLKGINQIQSYILAMNDITSNSEAEIFGFSLDKDKPPSIQSNIPLATAKLLRYIEKSEVIKIIQFLLHEKKEQQKKPVNSEFLSRILMTLEHQKHKRHTRINKRYGCRAIIGIDDLVNFLLEKEGKKIFVSATKTNNHEDDLDSLQVILDWDTEKQTNETSPIIENLQIVDSSMSGYGITWNNNIAGKLQIGEVIGIIPDFTSTIKKIEIGLIRRIKVTNENILFGVELIGLESTLIYIEREHSYMPGEWVLFLFGSPKFDVGVLCHKKRNYQVGDSILVKIAEKKEPCQLGAILNSTPVLEHFTLIY